MKMAGCNNDLHGSLPLAEVTNVIRFRMIARIFTEKGCAVGGDGKIPN